tara:strand:- start:7979 stop:8194 length:216 start_codon:yes stop_codon:yes gene_type:complete
MSAEALARLATAQWLAAEAACDDVEAAITNLFDAIEAAELAWGPVRLPEAREAERDLRNLSKALWVANYGR